MALNCKLPFYKVAFLQINTFKEVLEVFRTAKRSLGEIISSFEFIDHEAMKCVTENLGLSCPLGISEKSFYVLIETSGSHSAHDDEKLNAFLENSLNSGLVANGIMASEPSKILQLWYKRNL
jgi:D-2-hydroxyglutarate dehydrogenase